MAPAWQEIIWRAAQRSLAVMCPACWCSPGGLLALMGSANRVLIIHPNGVEVPMKRQVWLGCVGIDRLCHHASCVDGPRLARDHLACSAEVACSHVSGLLVQSGWTAGPDGVREPSPHHHSNGIDVPMKRQ